VIHGAAEDDRIPKPGLVAPVRVDYKLIAAHLVGDLVERATVELTELAQVRELAIIELHWLRVLDLDPDKAGVGEEAIADQFGISDRIHPVGEEVPK